MMMVAAAAFLRRVTRRIALVSARFEVMRIGQRVVVLVLVVAGWFD